MDITSQIEEEFKEQLIFAHIDPEKYEIGWDEATLGEDKTIEELV